MKRKKITNNTTNKLGKTPTDDVPNFSPELRAEIDLLTVQDNEELAPVAFSRLQQLKAVQERQVEKNRSAESSERKKQARYASIAVPAAGVTVVGVLIDKLYLLEAGLAVLVVNVALNAKWLATGAVGYDPIPFRGAEDRVNYLNTVMQNHPGQPQTGTEQ